MFSFIKKVAATIAEDLPWKFGTTVIGEKISDKMGLTDAADSAAKLKKANKKATQPEIKITENNERDAAARVTKVVDGVSDGLKTAAEMLTDATLRTAAAPIWPAGTILSHFTTPWVVGKVSQVLKDARDNNQVYQRRFWAGAFAKKQEKHSRMDAAKLAADERFGVSSEQPKMEGFDPIFEPVIISSHRLARPK